MHVSLTGVMMMLTYLFKENHMKKLLALYFVFASVSAWAACHTESIMYQGRMITCTTCCYGNNCNTNCF